MRKDLCLFDRYSKLSNKQRSLKFLAVLKSNKRKIHMDEDFEYPLKVDHCNW